MVLLWVPPGLCQGATLLLTTFPALSKYRLRSTASHTCPKPFSGQELSTEEEKARDYSPWFFVFDGTKERTANCASVELKMMRWYLALSRSYDLQALSAQRDTVLKQRVLLIATSLV